MMRAQGYFIAPEKHRNFAEQVVAAYEAALWQPIETALRDGTRVGFRPAAGSEYPANTQQVDRWHNGGWWQMRPAQSHTRYARCPPNQETQHERHPTPPHPAPAREGLANAARRGLCRPPHPLANPEFPRLSAGQAQSRKGPATGRRSVPRRLADTTGTLSPCLDFILADLAALRGRDLVLVPTRPPLPRRRATGPGNAPLAARKCDGGHPTMKERVKSISHWKPNYYIVMDLNSGEYFPFLTLGGVEEADPSQNPQNGRNQETIPPISIQNGQLNASSMPG